MLFYCSMENIHIHIGVVDKLLKSMEDMLFPTEEQGLLFMDNFLKKVGWKYVLKMFLYYAKVCILWKSYQGRHSLEVSFYLYGTLIKNNIA